MANSGTYSRSDRTTTHVYEPDPHIIDDERPRRDQFDDNTRRMSLRAHGPTFTVDNNFSELKREYINYLCDINHVFPYL
jgi:hypothetical protein